jgi:hypothetical protein
MPALPGSLRSGGLMVGRRSYKPDVRVQVSPRLLATDYRGQMTEDRRPKRRRFVVSGRRTAVVGQICRRSSMGRATVS